MQAQQADRLIQNAEQKLTMAQNETARAGEDVVTHLICVNSREAISCYMQGFLLRHDVVPFEPVSLVGLLEQCREVDARFNQLDLSDIHCRFETHDRDYCLDRGQVDRCMVVAQQTREIVLHEAPGF